MDILELVDRLEELVAEARRMPIGQGVVIDRRRVLELVDQMRSTVPWEVREARDVVAERDAVIEEARREAEGIIHRAELQTEEMLAEHTVVQQAERRAQEVVQRAEERSQMLLDQAQEQVQARLRQADQAANNQMDEADRYALEMLRRLEQQLSAFNATVRGGIDALEERAAPPSQPAEPEYQDQQPYDEEDDERP